MAFLSNLRQENFKKCPNEFTINGNMIDEAKGDVVSECGVSEGVCE